MGVDSIEEKKVTPTSAFSNPSRDRARPANPTAKVKNMSIKNLNSNTGGATDSVPQNPLDFLKSYAGKWVTLKAKGFFIIDLVTKSGRIMRTDLFNGNIAGRYKVITDGSNLRNIRDFNGVMLRSHDQKILIRQLAWVEINGQSVRSTG